MDPVRLKKLEEQVSKIIEVDPSKKYLVCVPKDSIHEQIEWMAKAWKKVFGPNALFCRGDEIAVLEKPAQGSDAQPDSVLAIQDHTPTKASEEGVLR